MINPKLKTRVVHSQSKAAWNVIALRLGLKYKIARIPYYIDDRDEIFSTKEKAEALEIAQFISYCFNHSEQIMEEEK